MAPVWAAVLVLAEVLVPAVAPAVLARPLALLPSSAGERMRALTVPSRLEAKYRSARSSCAYELTACLSALPALNLGTREAGIWMGSPVRGLRPVDALRKAT